MMIKLAAGSAFNVLYCVTFMFPPQMASQTIGFPNVIARILTIPTIFLFTANEGDESNLPEVICLILSAISVFLTIFLDVNYSSPKRTGSYRSNTLRQ